MANRDLEEWNDYEDRDDNHTYEESDEAKVANLLKKALRFNYRKY